MPYLFTHLPLLLKWADNSSGALLKEKNHFLFLMIWRASRRMPRTRSRSRSSQRKKRL
jgi:hypothetical protein